MASLQPHTGTLGKRHAKHLLRRACFNYTKPRVDSLSAKSVSDAVDELFIAPPLSMPEPVDYKTGQPWINSGVPPISSGFYLRRMVLAWWVNEAMQDTSIVHKMAFFLHANFVTTFNSTTHDKSFFDYLELLRFYALGNFRVLSKKMSLNYSMLDYLDGRINTDDAPNENYAREFLELFTIGKGPQIGPGNYTNYTEQDIITASKLLSGWRSRTRQTPPDPQDLDPDTGITTGYPTISRHDTSDKTFSSAFNGQTIIGAVDVTDMDRELDDFVSMVFNQQETAKAICRKLYRYFVGRNLTTEVENDIITPLANTFRTSDYNLETTLKQLLKSQHFYDMEDSDATNETIGNLIKSPLELFLEIITFFDVQVPDVHTDAKTHHDDFYRRSIFEIMFPSAGLKIFEPETVAGYSAYYQEPGYHRNWIDASTIIGRYKIPEMFITGQRLLVHGDLYARLDVVDFVQTSAVVTNIFDAQTLVTDLTEYLFSEAPSPDRFDYLLNDVFLNGAPAYDWTQDWVDYLNTGDDSAIRIPLEELFKTILFSQEYQVK